MLAYSVFVVCSRCVCASASAGGGEGVEGIRAGIWLRDALHHGVKNDQNSQEKMLITLLNREAGRCK